MVLLKLSREQSSSKSAAQLEIEVASLQRQLQRAEETVRSLQSANTDQRQHEDVQQSLRKSEARLEAELADTKLLQRISSYLIQQDNIDTLYTKIVEAALAIMQSDFATIQMYYPERGRGGELHLLASSGLNQEGKDFWAWVGMDAGTTCAVAMKTGKRYASSDMQNCEYVVGTPDHAVFIKAGVMSAQSAPLFSRSGKLLGMISTHWGRSHTASDRDYNLLDILARQAADLIERKIAEEELQKGKTALMEADRRKDEFLAMLAHELRNPLSPIRSALHLMRIEPMSDKTPELVAMMDKQVSHLVRLVDDLLDVSRLSEGKIDLRKEKMALQKAIQDAVEASRPLIESSNHTLTLSIPEEPLWIHADLTRTAQIVGNLLNNSAKYTPPGGHITVSVNSENGQAVVSVSDTGVGIADDMLPKIFELFTQVDQNLNRSQGGLGIGLSLVQQLLVMHEGTIEVKSAGLNQGSTFTIRLPLAAESEAGDGITDKTRHIETTAAKALRVVVVDDNVDSAKTVGWMLEMAGHDYKLAHNGADALVTAEAFHPDAILLDIGLPGMNGYELCRELRNDPRYRNTIIIAQTGWGQERDRQLAKEAGFDHHLVKPLRFEELSRLLAG